MLIPGFLKKVEFIPFLYQKKLDKMIMALKDICGYAKRRNIMVVLEDFDGKEAPFATAEQLSVFLKRIPDLYCAFDTGNFLYSGEDSLKVLPLFIDRIRHVHCKDRSFTAKFSSLFKKFLFMTVRIDKIVRIVCYDKSNNME